MHLLLKFAIALAGMLLVSTSASRAESREELAGIVHASLLADVDAAKPGQSPDNKNRTATPPPVKAASATPAVHSAICGR